MTALDLYKHGLIELNKIEAPNLLLDDYVYFINKAVQQYTNLISAKLELDQQSLDDLRALKRTIIKTVDSDDYGYFVNFENKDKYLHLLNCIVNYKYNGKTCNNKQNSLSYAARKLNPDIYTQIINNSYLKPDYKRPYYYISEKWDDNSSSYDISDPQCFRLDIRCGSGLYVPQTVQIDYLKTPEPIKLTLADVRTTEDETAKLEFSDYVCYEIINIFVRLVMENQSDPRIQTNMPINNTIPSPQTLTNNND